MNIEYYACCPEPFKDVFFAIQLQRKQSIYNLAVFCPAYLVIFLTLLSFWISPTLVVEKFLLHGISGIICCVMLLYFFHIHPITPDATPLLSRFYYGTFYMTLIALLITTFIINLAKNGGPVILISLLKKSFLFRAMLPDSHSNAVQHPLEDMDRIITPVYSETDQNMPNESAEQNNSIICAKIIDRFVFIIYLIYFLVWKVFFIWMIQ